MTRRNRGAVIWDDLLYLIAVVLVAVVAVLGYQDHKEPQINVGKNGVDVQNK